MRSVRAMVTTLVAGATLGVGASVVNNVPHLLGEVGEARADRSGWSQAAEFASLILDSGWAWAALAVLVGWLVTGGAPPGAGRRAGMLVAAAAGCAALVVATVVYDGVDALFAGGLGGTWQTRFWLVGSLVLGPPLGVVGAVARRPGVPGVLATLVVPVGAALNMVVLPPPGESRVATPVTVVVWAGAAAATAAVLPRAVHTWRSRRLPPP